MLGNFKTFTAERLDLDELVSLSAFGKQLRAEYEAHQIEEPEFVGIQLNAVKREIQSRVADSRESRKRAITAQLQQLKTPAERRVELQAELEKLDAQPV